MESVSGCIEPIVGEKLAKYVSELERTPEKELSDEEFFVLYDHIAECPSCFRKQTKETLDDFTDTAIMISIFGDIE